MSHVVALNPQQVSPEMRSGTGLKPDERCRNARAIGQQLRRVSVRLTHDPLLTLRSKAQ